MMQNLLNEASEINIMYKLELSIVPVLCANFDFLLQIEDCVSDQLCPFFLACILPAEYSCKLLDV